MSLTFFESILKASLVIGVGAVLIRQFRSQAAAIRHLIWITTLSIAILIPILTPFVPARRFAVLPPERYSAVQEPVAPAPEEVRTTPSTSLPRPTNTAGPTLPATSTILLAVWLLGGLMVAGRYLAGAAAIRTIARRESLTASAEMKLTAEALGMPSRASLRVCTAKGLSSPMTWGIRRPIILLPAEAQQWPDARLEAVLHHEIAHVRRFDFASQLLAELACALYWFNPIVWLGARAMRAEAETAADDAVLRSGVQPSAYAAELLQLAADFGRRQPSLSRVGIPIMVQPKIETRLKSVLAPSARRRGVTTTNVLLALAIAACAVPALAGLHAGAMQSATRSAEEAKESISRMKQVCLATLMYSSDYDDRFPMGNSTASIAKVLYPYAKNNKIFESPTAGARFLFNFRLAGVSATVPPEPANTIAWYEQLPNPHEAFVVGYMDGHVKLRQESERATFLKELAVKFK